MISSHLPTTAYLHVGITSGEEEHQAPALAGMWVRYTLGCILVYKEFFQNDLKLRFRTVDGRIDLAMINSGLTQSAVVFFPFVNFLDVIF